MVCRMITLFLCAMLFAGLHPASAQESGFSVALKGNLTTASQLFPNPNSADDFSRAQFFAIEDFFGYGIEVRYQIPETHLAAAVSADYIHARLDRTIGSPPVPAKDGYRVIPVELTGYFIIPVSGPTFGVYMGGGVGAYFGHRVYEVAGVEARTTEPGQGFGIHVLGGVSYHINEWFGFHFEMKFRDLQFKTSNQFSTASTIYNNTFVMLPQGPFASRVHTDGVIFQIGTSVRF